MACIFGLEKSRWGRVKSRDLIKSPGARQDSAMTTDAQTDLAYQNGAFIAGSDSFLARWAAAAAAFRQGLGAHAQLAQAYGPAERHRFDLFLPQGTPRGLMVFVHGGYWLTFDRTSWSHLATGVLARGWACAMPSYTLAPAARISDITLEIARAVQAAAARVAGPVVVAGHSAGGHLAARMGCADLEMPRVRRVVPISPIAELAPLMQTAMQADLRLTPQECATESPGRLVRNPDVSAHVWVGAQERPAFLWQARTLSEHWDCDWTAARGRHHFDVIDDLADPVSDLTRLCTLED